MRSAIDLEETYLVGTGYGRVTLPFSKEHIRSEILCHGLGAHMMYPNTRTVLDIGGQDTKGIQVDANGIVENFQMNDRCAAGCGRYLGYIADEMNMGLHELGPMAMKSDKPARINSTCTVFAGAELRDRLSLGEKREDILAGLHRAIILRAISIISRSGGVTNEFTFTGGVAKNEAAVRELRKVIKENYGEVTININPDSIYTGALGAAEFARRAHFGHADGSADMTIAAGIDVGTGAVKAAIFKVEDGKETWLSRSTLRIRQRDPIELARVVYDHALEDARLTPNEVDYVATTGEGESRALPYRPLLLDDDARARRHLSRSRVARGARHRRAARPRDQHRRARQGLELQDDEPVRIGIGPVPGEHRPLSRHRPGGNRRAVARGRQSGSGVEHLRRAGGDRRDQHGVARHHRAEHSQGHPPVDGGTAVEALEIDRRDAGRRDDAPAGWRSTTVWSPL